VRARRDAAGIVLAKITAVDSSYSLPEGTPSPNAQLILWNDEPTRALFYHDNQPSDPDPTDSLLYVEQHEAYPTGTHRGMIIDSTQATRYQIFRRESNGGVRQLFNFALMPTRKWLQSLTEAYSFADQSPSGLSSYIGRGLVGGVANATSPLTNFPSVSVNDVTNIAVDAHWPIHHDPPVQDTTKIVLDWAPVTGAARYLIQVYSYRADIGPVPDQILSGSPAPLYDGATSDSYVAFAPPNVTTMLVGDSTRTDIKVIQIRPILPGASMLVRISALDNQGHMIGLTLGDPNPLTGYGHGDYGLVRNAAGIGTYMLYPLSATTARTLATTGGGGGGGGGAPN
jgi:hypothetical protein